MHEQTIAKIKMAQNINKQGINKILELLDGEISKDIEQPLMKFTLIAVGGTSLTLRDIKPSTKDVDFMADGIEIEKIRRYARKVYEKNKCKIDLWQSPHVFSTTLLQDFSSDIYHLKYKHFDIRIINLIDNAVAKLSRFNETDREDIENIIKAGVNANEIARRFKDTLENSGFADKEEAKRNLEIFERIIK